VNTTLSGAAEAEGESCANATPANTVEAITLAEMMVINSRFVRRVLVT
jgi:hypothetical protein